MYKAATLLLVLLATVQLNAQSSWKLVYQNDQEGNKVEGNIENLKIAVKSGQAIRISWWSRPKPDGTSTVYHLADASFLTILNDTIVFGQIEPIYGQTPDVNNGSIALKENLEWVMIAGTNGKSDAMTRNMTTGEILGHNQSNRAFKWYVKE